MRLRLRTILKCALLLVLSGSTIAASLGHEAFIVMQERAHDIPTNLLRAISHVESGRNLLGTFTAWPWTINVEGRSYIFKTKCDAIKAVEKFQRLGIKNIDVGIMQINLHHHSYGFRSLKEAFDPQLNIAYGAKFLKQLFNQHKNWGEAVGHYHSANPKFHDNYRRKVLKNLAKISTKHEEKGCVNGQIIHERTKQFSENMQLSQIILHSTDLRDIDSEAVRSRLPRTAIRLFAKIKRAYATLASMNLRSSRSGTAQKPVYIVDSRQSYVLD